MSDQELCTSTSLKPKVTSQILAQCVAPKYVYCWFSSIFWCSSPYFCLLLNLKYGEFQTWCHFFVIFFYHLLTQLAKLLYWEFLERCINHLPILISSLDQQNQMVVLVFFKRHSIFLSLHLIDSGSSNGESSKLFI